MPELPEVETIRQDLIKAIDPAEKIEKILLRRQDIRFPIPADFIMRLKGKKFSTIRRRAKYLLFDAGDEIMISHLGMSGGWIIKDVDFQASVHDHCEITFSNSQTLVYRDPRRFGVLDIVRPSALAKHKLFAHLGPEPLDPKSFSADILFQRSRKVDRSLKSFIMDQEVVVGVGNIYASEALFLARLSPIRMAKGLKFTEAARLYEAIVKTLTLAIAAGGSSIRDYRSIRGQQGEFQGQHWVYNRKDELCRQCSSPIKGRVIGGRSTFWCPKCQGPTST